MRVLETDRLVLRHLDADDAPFVLQLLNDPDWLRFIGDRGIRTLDGALGYIADGPVASYARHGFGLYLVELKEGSLPMGLCGLIKRDALPDVDVGFAFLPAFRAKGYAREATAAVLEQGRTTFGLKRIVAITSLDNDTSIQLLEKLGFRLEKTMTLPNDTEVLNLFAIDV